MMLHYPMRRLWRCLLLSGGLLVGGLLISSEAQVSTSIRPDGTLSTTVLQQGTL